MTAVEHRFSNLCATELAVAMDQSLTLKIFTGFLMAQTSWLNHPYGMKFTPWPHISLQCHKHL